MTSLSSSERPSSKPQVCAIDIGTSGVRAALFDERGHELPGAQARSRRTFTTVSDFAELDADQLVDEVIKTVDELLASHSSAQIEFIAISAFWHSLIGIDAAGLPTTPVLTWADTRAAQFAKRCAQISTSSRFTRAQAAVFIPVTGPRSSNGSRASTAKNFTTLVAGLDLPNTFACACLASARHRSRWRLPRDCSINETATGTWGLMQALGISAPHVAGNTEPAGASHPS